MDRGRGGAASPARVGRRPRRRPARWSGAVLYYWASMRLLRGRPEAEKRNVLELGAGCGLAGLAWALTEDQSHAHGSAHRLQALRENARRNGVEATVAALDWTRALEDAAQHEALALQMPSSRRTASTTRRWRRPSCARCPARCDGSVAFVAVDEDQ